MKRVPIAPPGDMFWGRELIGEELTKAERGYIFESLLEGVHFSYVCTLNPQLIDVVASDFVPPSSTFSGRSCIAFGFERWYFVGIPGPFCFQSSVF